MSDVITNIVRTMPKVRDGEPFTAPKKGNSAEFVHRCCDCGARHDVKVTVGSRNLTFRFWRLHKKGKS